MNSETCKPIEHHFFNLGTLDAKTYVIACEKCGEIREFQSAMAAASKEKDATKV